MVFFYTKESIYLILFLYDKTYVIMFKEVDNRGVVYVWFE